MLFVLLSKRFLHMTVLDGFAFVAIHANLLDRYRRCSIGIFNPGKKCGIVGRNIGYAASFSLGISTAPMAL